VPYQTQYERGYLYSALAADGGNAAEFLCWPRVALEMSRMFLEHVAACDPPAEPVVIQDPAGFQLNPELPELPPQSPELNPGEAIGDVIKDRIGNTLWTTLEALEAALGGELRPIYESAERVRSLVSHDMAGSSIKQTLPQSRIVHFRAGNGIYSIASFDT
jgi:hypothetical protein